jgi:hypothetical protein
MAIPLEDSRNRQIRAAATWRTLLRNQEISWLWSIGGWSQRDNRRPTLSLILSGLSLPSLFAW